MALSFSYSPWLLVASLLVAAGLTYWSYRRTVPSLTPAWRLFLGGLRFVSLTLVLFLLVEPVVRQFSESTRPPLLGVLVDHTESIRLVTGQPDTTAAGVQSTVQPLLTSFQEDLGSGTSQVFTFGADIRSIPDASTDSLKFDGSRTDIAAALEQLPSLTQGANLRGVVLVSDGLFNAGRTPLRVADRYPVPIHTVTIGDTTQQRDLAVRRVTTNDVAYTDAEVPVQATLQAQRIDATTVTVTVSEEDTVRAETDVRLPGGTAEIPVSLSFRPSSPGLKQLTVRASAVPEEVTTRNNARSTTVRVLDRKRRILLLGAAPSPSVTAVRRVLERDANADLTVRIPRRDGSFYGGPFPDTLSDYDAVVSAGFPSSVVPRTAVERTRDALDDGVPAVFFLHRQTDLSAWTEHFQSHLPALPESVRLAWASGAAAIADDAAQHPIFRIEDASPNGVGQLPPLEVPTGTWTPTPDADVLAVTQRPSQSEPAPLLVVRRRAGHRTALFLGTATWRWSLLPQSLSSAEPFWPGLVSNLVRWVSTQAEDQQVRIRPVASQFDGDESVRFTGEVYDESMAPLPSATVDVTISDTTGAKHTSTMTPTGDGQYALDVGPLPEGRFQYQAVAQHSGSVLGRDQGQFSVGALQLEYQTAQADPVLMRQIAQRSGGTAYTSDRGSDLPAELAASSSFSPEVKTSTTEIDLWNRWPFLLVLLVTLGTEWTARKRLGLP